MIELPKKKCCEICLTDEKTTGIFPRPIEWYLVEGVMYIKLCEDCRESIGEEYQISPERVMMPFKIHTREYTHQRLLE